MATTAATTRGMGMTTATSMRTTTTVTSTRPTNPAPAPRTSTRRTAAMTTGTTRGMLTITITITGTNTSTGISTPTPTTITSTITAMNTAMNTARAVTTTTTTTTTTIMGTGTEARGPALPSQGTAGLLSLIWLASPALPVGGFSYSEGLEAAVEWAGVSNEATAADWLLDQLHLGLARGALAVLAASVQALSADRLDRLAELNQWVLHTRETSELRLQSVQMGRSLIDWLRNLQPAQAERVQGLGLTYPVAFAAAAAGSSASTADICAAYAFGWCENMSQTAIKAVPLGQSAGQRILARLAAEIPAAVAGAMALDDAGRQAFTPRLAVLSARHETQYSRLFRS